MEEWWVITVTTMIKKTEYYDVEGALQRYAAKVKEGYKVKEVKKVIDRGVQPTNNFSLEWQNYNSDIKALLKKTGSNYSSEMFTKLAKETYDKTGVLIPAAFVISQLQLETGVGKKGKDAYNNPANVLAYDSGRVKLFNSPEESLRIYYKTMTNYLKNKKVDDLLFEKAEISNATLDRKTGKYYDSEGKEVSPQYSKKGSFVNEAGDRYASDPDYEEILKKIYRGNKVFLEKLPKFKLGGLVSKIADGVYHSRKNKLADNPRLKKLNLTSKGVPVVYKDEQKAEIEKNELVLRAEVATKIDKLRNEYKKTNENSLLYKIGVLFADEIKNNTIDSKDKLLDDTK